MAKLLNKCSCTDSKWYAGKLISATASARCTAVAPRYLSSKRTTVVKRKHSISTCNRSLQLRCKAGEGGEEDPLPPPWKITGGDLVSDRKDVKLDATKQAEVDQQATNAIGALADALAALSEDVLKRMSADQRRDFRDVCVELRTGGMGRDLAQEEALQTLADALYKDRDTKVAADACRKLTLPAARTKDRTALARRLTCATRYAQMFETTKDPENDKELGKLTVALTDCAVAVSVGTEAEAATKAAITNERKKVVEVGPLRLELSAQQAATGSALALALSYGGWRLASIYDGDLSSTREPGLDMIVAASADDTANIRVQLQDTFGDVAGLLARGFSAVSVVVGFALLVLTLSMVEENFEDAER